MQPARDAGYASQDVVAMSRWLIAEKEYYTNYIHSAMYQKQMELTAELHATRERNGQLLADNTELRGRLAKLTQSYATFILNVMTLAEPNEPTPSPLLNRWRHPIRGATTTTRTAALSQPKRHAAHNGAMR